MNAYVKHQQVLPNGEELAYHVRGTGQDHVIFVHGNMSSGLHFEPLLERLPENIKAYVPDLRGFGDSSYNKPIDSLEDFADDLHAFVSAQGLEEFTLVGWSTGGGICMAYDVKYPGKTKKMVLIETVSYLGYPLYEKNAEGQAIDGACYATREAMGLDPVQVLPAVKAMEDKDAGYMNFLWDLAIYSVNKPNPEANQRYIEETLKQRNLIDVDWALANFNMSNGHNGYKAGDGSIEKIQVPVMAFWGDKDYVVLEHMVKETVEAIGENASYHVLKDSGHSPLIDCPDLLAEHISNFIAE